MKGLSPTYLGDSPYQDPSNPITKQGNGPATLYPVSIVPDDPLRGRLSDTLDYNVAIVSTPETIVRGLTITGIGDYPQNAIIGLGFTPSSLFIRAFHSGSWGYSEAYIDLTKASIKSGKGVQTYTTYVSTSAIIRLEDTTSAIKIVSTANVTATIGIIPNGFNINVSTFTSNVLVHYIAYQ